MLIVLNINCKVMNFKYLNKFVYHFGIKLVETDWQCIASPDPHILHTFASLLVFVTLISPNFFFLSSCIHGYRTTPISHSHSLFRTSFRLFCSSDRLLRSPELRRAASLLRPQTPTCRRDRFCDTWRLENCSSRRTHHVRGTRYCCWRLAFDFVAESGWTLLLLGFLWVFWC